MGAFVFNNEIFDSWLNKKSDEILSKVDRERISTEEMIILVLKAQTNHFYHMDIDMRGQFLDVNKRFEQVEKRFEQVDKRFEQVDSRFERVEADIRRLDYKIDNRFMWTIGIMVTLFAGVYLKLFLG